MFEPRRIDLSGPMRLWQLSWLPSLAYVPMHELSDTQVPQYSHIPSLVLFVLIRRRQDAKGIGLATIMIVLYIIIAAILVAVTSAATLLPSRKPTSTTRPNISNSRSQFDNKEATISQSADLSKGLPDHITAPFLGSSDNNQIDRANWVRRATDYVFNDRHRAKYNVLTINDDLEYHLNVGEILEEFRVKQKTPAGKTVPFRIVVFNEAELVNFGDGGYINWCFEGWFTRTGKGTVSFRRKR